MNKRRAPRRGSRLTPQIIDVAVEMAHSGVMSATNDLRSIVSSVFGNAVIRRVVPLRGGVSAGACAVELTHDEGRSERIVVRQPQYASGRSARAEFNAIQFAYQSGIRVPKPLHVDAPRQAVILEYVPGALDMSVSGISQRLHCMAEELAKIHRLSTTALDLTCLPRRFDTARQLIERSVECYDQTLGERQLREYLHSIWPWKQDNADVLLHGDYWPGNILWRDGKLCAVIDWEESEIGDPLADLAVARLDILWVFGVDAMFEFTQCYRRLTDLNWARLPHWDLCVALRPMHNLERWVTSYAGPPCNRPDVTLATMRQGHRQFVEQALEALNRQEE